MTAHDNPDIVPAVKRCSSLLTLASLGWLGISCAACSGAAKSSAPATATPAPAPAAPASPSAAALAEVARLTALADQDPLLQPWSGPYGGVPPWDKLQTDHIA